MHARGRWRWLRTAMLALALTLVASNLDIGFTWSDQSVALAQDKDDDDEQKDTKNRGNDDDADHEARGQVIGIDTLKDPPELTLAGMDGEMIVRVLKTDEIALHGVKLCWHIKVEGEKIHELLFEATQIEVETKKKC